MGDDRAPTWVVVLLLLAAAIMGLLVGLGVGENRVFHDINNGDILFQECQELTTTKTVQGTEFLAQEWYCITGD